MTERVERGHVPALDGVRGLAIIAVILFHYTWLSCGWAGVQVFFVLSGYLITSILLADRRLTFGAYLARFYWRRSLRIFPAYFGYLAVLTVAFVLAGVPQGFERLWPYLWTYTSNFRRLLLDYQMDTLISHLWSLSVEEQFYLMWPVLIFLLPRRALQRAIVVIVALGPVVRLVTVAVLRHTSQDPHYLGQAVYGATFCQLDAFAAGAAAVVFRDTLAKHEGRNFTVCLLVLLAAGQIAAVLSTGSFALDTTFGYPTNMFANGQYVWGYTLLNVWAASLLLLARRPGPISALLGSPALVYVGRISYGMYLFHPAMRLVVFLMVGERHGLENLVAFALYVGLVVGVASVSYYAYESIFLRLKNTRFQVTG